MHKTRLHCFSAAEIEAIVMSRQQYKDFVIKYEGGWVNKNKTKMSMRGGGDITRICKTHNSKLTQACLEIHFAIHMKHTGSLTALFWLVQVYTLSYYGNRTPCSRMQFYVQSFAALKDLEPGY